MRTATVARQRRVPGNNGTRSAVMSATGTPAAAGSPGVASSPLVTQLAQLNKHGARVRTLAEVRKCVTQACDDRGALESEERVDVLLLSEGRNSNGGRVCAARLRQQSRRPRVVGLAIEGELEIACQILVPGKHARTVRQSGLTCHKGIVE